MREALATTGSHCRVRNIKQRQEQREREEHFGRGKTFPESRIITHMAKNSVDGDQGRILVNCQRRGRCTFSNEDSINVTEAFKIG